MRFPALTLLLTLSLCAAACTTMVPRSKLPYPLTNDTFGKEVKVVTVPLPVVATSPNEGLYSGALVAFLLHNKKDEISTLLVPQLNYNRFFGVSATLFGAIYPSSSRRFEFNLSKSAHVNEDYEFTGVDRSLFKGRAEGSSYLYVFTDGSARFYGFGSNSLQANETNFGDRESGIRVSLAYKIVGNLRLVVGDRFKRVGITQGAVRSIPFIGDKFNSAEVPGIDGYTVHAQKVGLVFSVLDLPSLPTAGFYAEMSAEGSEKELGSSADFVHYHTEIKGYVPTESRRWISVFRIAYNQTYGKRTPFLEQSILGGENTLRGYGRNRFIDSAYLLLNLEERIRVFRWKLFNVLADWEVAPFLDCGGVMRSPGSVRRGDFKINPGIGLRAVVRPNIVGRADIGFGDEGVAVFVGLGYPF